MVNKRIPMNTFEHPGNSCKLSCCLANQPGPSHKCHRPRHSKMHKCFLWDGIAWQFGSPSRDGAPSHLHHSVSIVASIQSDRHMSVGALLFCMCWDCSSPPGQVGKCTGAPNTTVGGNSGRNHTLWVHHSGRSVSQSVYQSTRAPYSMQCSA